MAGRTKARGAKSDAGRNELIRVGAPVTVLTDIFGVDAVFIRRAIAKHRIQPRINDAGQELYAIREVAPYLVDLSKAVDIEAVLKTTTLKKLPPELTKNFWDAYNSRKKALEDDKQLWRTEAVLEVLLDVFTTLRQSVNQFVDTISDRVKVTAEQQREIEAMCDGLIASMREKLLDQFSLYAPNAEERFVDDDITRDESEKDEFDDEDE